MPGDSYPNCAVNSSSTRSVCSFMFSEIFSWPRIQASMDIISKKPVHWGTWCTKFQYSSRPDTIYRL